MIVDLENQARVYEQPRRTSNAPMARNYRLQLDAQLTELRDAAEARDRRRAHARVAVAGARQRLLPDAIADAEREYRNAIVVNSRLGEAHNNLAVVYLMTNPASDASVELTAAEKAGFKVNPQLKEG